MTTTRSSGLSRWETAALFGLISVIFLDQLVGVVHMLDVKLVIYGLRMAGLLQSIPLMGPGYDVGIEAVNREYTSTLNVTRVFISSQEMTQCNDIEAYFDTISAYYYHVEKGESDVVRVLTYLGCGGTQTFAQLAREWNMLAISGGTTFNLRDRQLFPTTISLGPFQFAPYPVMVEKVCGLFNWRTAGFVYDTSRTLPFPLQVYDLMLSHFRTSRPTLRLQLLAIPATSPDFGDVLRRISDVCRVENNTMDLSTVPNLVIFVAATPFLTRQLMIEALKQNKTTSEYVSSLLLSTNLNQPKPCNNMLLDQKLSLCVCRYNKVWISLDLPEQAIGPITWYRNDTDDAVALQAFSSLMQIITCYDHKEEANRQLKEQIRQRAALFYNYQYPTGKVPSEFATSAYETVKLLAEVLNNSLEKGLNYRDGRVLANQFLGRKYDVGSIGSVYVDRHGERQNKICFNIFDTTTRNFARAMYYDYTQSTLQTVANVSIRWTTRDRMAPPDTPWCGFRGDSPQCVGTIPVELIVGLAVFFILLLLLLTGAALRYLFLARLHLSHDLWWRIDNDFLARVPTEDFGTSAML